MKDLLATKNENNKVLQIDDNVNNESAEIDDEENDAATEISNFQDDLMIAVPDTQINENCQVTRDTSISDMNIRSNKITTR